jgi:peptidoglycan/LPS O-acetylase OafA/YrhL
MGMLRLWLALAVMLDHCNYYFGLGFRTQCMAGLYLMEGSMAVRIFFAISGYYMAMVYEERYRRQFKSFILSRWFRFFPPYYLVLGLSAALLGWAYYVKGNALGPYECLQPGVAAPGPWSLGFVRLTSFTLVGQEWSSAIRLPWDGGRAFLSLHDTPQAFAAGSYQWVPQAWSLGLEEVFCLTLPLWTALSSRWLGILTLLGALARYGLLATGCNQEQALWLPPVELCTFFAGILAWRLGPKFQAAPAWLRYLGFATFAFLVLGSGYLGISLTNMVTLLTVLGIFVLGPLFQLTRNISWDRRLGDLSYPLYLVHLLVIFACCIPTDPVWHHRMGLAAPFLCMAVAVVLGSFVIRPLDGWRKRFWAQAEAAQARREAL